MLAGLVAVLPVFYALPESRDVPLLGAVLGACLGGVFVLDALNAPRWTALVLIAGSLGAWWVVAHRREAANSGRIRIPPGYRFRERKRK